MESATSTVPGCQHCIVSAIVYTVGAKITSTINEKASTISLFQSSLVSLLSVNELRFRHRYQQRRLFNYSYWACSVCHCRLEFFSPYFPFFCFLRNCVYTQPGGVENGSLNSGCSRSCVCARDAWSSGNAGGIWVTRQSFCFRRCIMMNTTYGSEHKQEQVRSICEYFDMLFGYERSCSFEGCIWLMNK